MRILFIHPNYHSGGAEIAGTWPPAWVAYLAGSLRTAVDELGALCLGEDPRDIERIGRKLTDAVGAHCGPGGIFTLAASAIDIALWDIKGKALGLPLWKLLGGYRPHHP